MKASSRLIVSLWIFLITGFLWAGLPEGELPEADLKTAAGAIYHPDPAHLWNRLHLALFAREGEGFEAPDPGAVDPPLWPRTNDFLVSGPSYHNATAALDEFLNDDGHALIVDPLKRAVLQHDLWSVFDWATKAARVRERGDENQPHLVELRSRLASAVGLLALSSEEIATLPDNLANAAASGEFGTSFDPENPRVPFVPDDLLDPDGGWVCVRGAASGPSAPVHSEYYQGRSPFLVFLHIPGGGEPTRQYIKDLNRASREADDLPLFPIGTKVALLRQMTVIDDGGGIQATPITQTLQMRVYRQVGEDVKDHENSQSAVKFRMRRAGLFSADHAGLQPIGWEDPLAVSLLNPRDIYDDEGQHSSIDTTMASCIACHSCGGATVDSIFTYRQDDWLPSGNLIAPNRLRLSATDPATEAARSIRWKTSRYEWGVLMGLREGQPPSR